MNVHADETTKINWNLSWYRKSTKTFTMLFFFRDKFDQLFQEKICPCSLILIYIRIFQFINICIWCSSFGGIKNIFFIQFLTCQWIWLKVFKNFPSFCRSEILRRNLQKWKGFFYVKNISGRKLLMKLDQYLWKQLIQSQYKTEKNHANTETAIGNEVGLKFRGV